MTITLDAWQPILVALIGGIFALGVPVISAWLSSRSSRKAAAKATEVAVQAVTTAAESTAAIGDKVDKVSKKLDEHASTVAQMNVKINGERTALMQRVAQQEQEIIQLRRRASENPDAR